MSTMKVQKDRWLTNDQAAEYLGITPRMVRRAREKGDLACTRFGGTRVFHSPQQLNEWVERCTSSTPTAGAERSE